MFKKLSLFLIVIPKLGFRNVGYMVWYRLSMKLGWRKRKFPLGTPVEGPFFKATTPLHNYPEIWKNKTIEKANSILEGNLTWFHYHQFQVGNPPNWFLNPFDNLVLNNPNKHWTALSDFDLNTGDIKILWEPSRFDWLTDLARSYRVTGEEKYLDTVNQWLHDWSTQNPKNQGPNWKCGQETAIRVMKLITTAQILNQDNDALKSLQQMVAEHLERIAGNINYAMAQDNNHGTSEAAGLYIGAVWLLQQKQPNTKQLEKWKIRGRKLLENRISKLIAPQGTFAQRSVTYHRVVVDTLSWVLYAMERYQEPEFTAKIQDRLEKLGEWQYKLIAAPSGDAPNIGSNDGAMFETLHNGDYRDFRPSTQLFFGILRKQRVFDETSCDEPLFWRYPELYQDFPIIKIKLPEAEVVDNQFLILRGEETHIVLKIPSDQFRPSACDAFHLDVWHQGENILCDSGTYSYNAGAETAWFKSVQAHNTVQFGNAQQMPKLGRFLFGHWLNAEKLQSIQKTGKTVCWEGSFRDYKKRRHTRQIEWDSAKRQLVVTDTFEKPKNEWATIYWHTPLLLKDKFKLSCSDQEELKPTVQKTPASLYYMQKTEKHTLSYQSTSNRLVTQIQL